MTTLAGIFQSEAKRSEQASEQPAPAKKERKDRTRIDGRATDVEIAYLQKKIRDLRQGLTNLNRESPRASDCFRSLAEHGAKLSAAEHKLFRLRQIRLL